LLQHPGAKYSVHHTFQMYLEAIGYSPEKLWDLDDHGSSLMEQIRQQHKALSTALKTDRKSEEVEKYLSAKMLKEYENSKRSPQEREIADGLKNIAKEAKAAKTNAIIAVLKRQANNVNDCEVNVTALEYLCKHLQRQQMLVLTKKLKILSFVKEQIDPCEPWVVLEISRVEWLETYLQLAGILPKAPKVEAKEEEEEEDYNIPF